MPAQDFTTRKVNIWAEHGRKFRIMSHRAYRPTAKIIESLGYIFVADNVGLTQWFLIFFTAGIP